MGGWAFWKVMENGGTVAPDGNQTPITPWLYQKLTHYIDSSALNGRNLLAFQFHNQAKRDSKNGGIRLSNQLKGRYVIYDYFY
jgi:hypothetical protein